ncbi:MAG: hypothetical protein ACYTGL_14220 [Planctomycetota bacterium]|jgi:hypothetical protein
MWFSAAQSGTVTAWLRLLGQEGVICEAGQAFMLLLVHCAHNEPDIAAGHLPAVPNHSLIHESGRCNWYVLTIQPHSLVLAFCRAGFALRNPVPERLFTLTAAVQASYPQFQQSEELTRLIFLQRAFVKLPFPADEKPVLADP